MSYVVLITYYIYEINSINNASTNYIAKDVKEKFNVL